MPYFRNPSDKLITFSRTVNGKSEYISVVPNGVVEWDDERQMSLCGMVKVTDGQVAVTSATNIPVEQIPAVAKALSPQKKSAPKKHI